MSAAYLLGVSDNILLDGFLFNWAFMKGKLLLLRDLLLKHMFSLSLRKSPSFFLLKALLHFPPEIVFPLKPTQTILHSKVVHIVVPVSSRPHLLLLCFPLTSGHMNSIILIDDRDLTQLAPVGPGLTLLEVPAKIFGWNIEVTILTILGSELTRPLVAFDFMSFEFKLTELALFRQMKFLVMLLIKILVIWLSTDLTLDNIPAAIPEMHGHLDRLYLLLAVLTSLRLWH